MYKHLPSWIEAKLSSFMGQIKKIETASKRKHGLSLLACLLVTNTRTLRKRMQRETPTNGLESMNPEKTHRSRNPSPLLRYRRHLRCCLRPRCLDCSTFLKFGRWMLPKIQTCLREFSQSEESEDQFPFPLHLSYRRHRDGWKTWRDLLP